MANTTQLKNLLKKKGWTGTEVGKLLIASMLNDIKQTGQEETTPLFSQTDFEHMESSLTSDWDYITYGVYRDLYSSIIDSFNRGQGIYQQFYNGFSNILTNLLEVRNADNAQKSFDNMPVIMTESQYARLRKEASNILNGKQISFCGLVFYCLERFLDSEDAVIKSEAPGVWKALEATKKKPAAGKFLPLYNEIMGKGYYTLPDGRRSDEMTNAEWQRALSDEFRRNFRVQIDGRPATLVETLQEYNTQHILTCQKLYYEGADSIRKAILENTGNETDLTDEELLNALDDIIKTTGNAHYSNPNAAEISATLDNTVRAEWHTYENPPDDLTMYDLLPLYVGEYNENINISGGKEALQLLKKDVSPLYNAIKEYIEERVPNAGELKNNQLYKPFISWGKLAAFGVIGFAECVQVTDQDIIETATAGEDTSENDSKRHRTERNGIAILRSPAADQVDENGDYIETSPLYHFRTLYSLWEDPEQANLIRSYADNLIYPALSYLYAFNALMEIFGEVYDLPDLPEVANFDMSTFITRMNGYNGLVYLFYHDVYGSQGEKQLKRSIIKEIFPILETDTLKPSQETINEITAELKKCGFSSETRKKLKYLDSLLDRLMSSRGGE